MASNSPCLTCSTNSPPQNAKGLLAGGQMEADMPTEPDMQRGETDGERELTCNLKLVFLSSFYSGSCPCVPNGIESQLVLLVSATLTWVSDSENIKNPDQFNIKPPPRIWT